LNKRNGGETVPNVSFPCAFCQTQARRAVVAEPQLRSSSHLGDMAAHPYRVLSTDGIQNVIQAISQIPIFHKDHVLRDETIGRRREYCGIAVQQK
jgi:hypothetical protein